MSEWKRVLSGKRILVVDDDIDNQELIKDILDGVNCVIDVASNGDEAVLMIKNKIYDLILMDLHMPYKTGYETTAEIRQFETEKKLGRTRIILLTADVITTNKKDCIQGQMDDYISKPIILDKFRDKLAEVLTRA